MNLGEIVQISRSVIISPAFTTLLEYRETACDEKHGGERQRLRGISKNA